MKTLVSLALESSDAGLRVLDQRELPHQERWTACRDPEHMVELISTLAVRGAPLIGVAAAPALADHARQLAGAYELHGARARLRVARPTAGNVIGTLGCVPMLLALAARTR